jgi:hypothetical protein
MPFGAEGRKKSRPVRIKITGILWAADASIVAYFCHSHFHPRLRLGFDQERETEVMRACKGSSRADGWTEPGTDRREYSSAREEVSL